MAHDPCLANQAAQVSAFQASVGLQELFEGAVPIYESVQSGTAKRYIVIGDDQAVDNSNSCSRGWELFSRVHIYAEGRDRQFCKRAAAEIEALWETAPDLEHFQVSAHRFLSADHALEENGTLAHTILQFRSLVYPAADT